MNIRKASSGDLARIQELNHQLFKHDSDWITHLNFDWPYKEGKAYFQKRIEGDGICLVAEDAGKLAGYMTGSLKDAESWRHVRMTELDTIFVDEKYRGSGVGKALVANFVSWSRQQGVQKIYVEASAPNENAINFYKSLGFEPYTLALEMNLESQKA